MIHGRSGSLMEEATMVQKLAAIVLIGAALAVTACNTVRGAASDVNSAASCTENAMHGGRC
jgi:predicted small secreted protein